ncbi:MAG: phage tail tube protein, partial [Burkholderiales bacterium]|nr:phage tail tube protein [Burkholderiales bacterium]
MPRYIRNTVITAKTEATPGVDAAPTGAANAILVSEMSITPLDAKNVDRNVIRGYFGASEQLVGVASVKVSITVELAGSGAAATAPAMSALFQGCAMAEALLTTPNRVEYTPVSTGLKTLTIYYYDDGVLHKLVGAMGTFSLSAKVGDRPTLKFEFTGLDGAMSVASTTGNYSAWKPPVAMTKANVVDITLGAAYAAGVLTGGTVYPSTGLELAMGNAVGYSALLSAERVDITDRDVTGSIELDLTAAQEVAFMTGVKANMLQSLALTIGTVSGSKLIIFKPA